MRKETKINSIVSEYNGNTNAFDLFMEAMINDFMDSDKIYNTSEDCIVDKVEKYSESA